STPSAPWPAPPPTAASASSSSCWSEAPAGALRPVAPFMALDPTATVPPEGYLRLGRLGRTFQLEGALRLALDAAVSYEGEDGAEPVGVRVLQGAGQLFVTGLGHA